MTLLTNARLALARLEQEGAPVRVLDAAHEAVRCYEANRPINPDIQHVLQVHAASRMSQNHFGK